MECDYLSHPYLKTFEDLETTRQRAPRSISTTLKALEGSDPREAQEALGGSEVLEDLRLLGYEELGGLSDPGP